MKKKYVVEIDDKGGDLATTEEVFEHNLNSNFVLLKFDVKKYKEPVKCVNCKYYTKSIPDLVSYCHRIERNVPVELGGCLKGVKNVNQNNKR